MEDGIPYEAFALGIAGGDREVAKRFRAKHRDERRKHEKSQAVQMGFQVTVFEPDGAVRREYLSISGLAEDQPKIARERYVEYLAADKQVPDPENPKSLHRYAFVEGNPIRFSDPTGHFCWNPFSEEFWTGDNWATLGVLIGLGLAIIFTAGLGVIPYCAAIGAFVFANWAAARGLSPIDADFWRSVAPGAIIGAAVGAFIGALPASLGFTPGLDAVAGFFVGLAADVLVGAVLGGLGPVVTHLAQGGGPEQLLTEELGLTITSALKGAILGAVFGVVLNPMAVLGTLGAVTGGLVTALITLEGLFELGLSGAHPGEYGTLLNLFGYDENWFRYSPAKRLGLPSWAFEGTWIYSGRSEESALLQTMPLAP